MAISKNALGLTGLMALGALASVSYALHSLQPLQGFRFWALLVFALVTAKMKVKLPGLTGSMSLNLPFILIAVAQLSMMEALLVALPSCAVQCFPKRGGKPKPVQLIFNLSTMGVAVAAARLLGVPFAPLGAVGFFLAQTIPVASIIRFTQGGAIHQIWGTIAHYSFPFYILSAGISSIATSYSMKFGWQVSLLSLLVSYAIYRSYESYLRVPSVLNTRNE